MLVTVVAIAVFSHDDAITRPFFSISIFDTPRGYRVSPRGLCNG